MDDVKVTLKQFTQLCADVFAQRKKIDEMEAELKPEKEKLEELKAKVLAHFESYDMEKFHVDGHGLLYAEDRFTVPVPKSIEAKKEFGKYLQKRGIFWEMMSINSATLNSFHKTEFESAIARGDVDFALPGVGEPGHQRTLKMRKG